MNNEMTEYIQCTECKTDVPWYYAWIWHPTIAMHPGCAQDRWDAEGCAAAGPDIRKYYEDLYEKAQSK